ncbi:GMC oxidoreductase [Microbacterium sp.]|uniref:GMC oxidoreductase n=1 Tax=Microbacterium sp. TaxID=51671 RepID=UPI003A85F933
MTETFDLVIVGSGINGAIVAHQARTAAPGASILVLEAGGPISGQGGEHLVEASEDTLREAYDLLMRRARQIEYVAGAVSMTEVDGDSWSPDATGVFPAAFLGHNFAQFPGASFGWNVGGMGVHWTAACPWPFATEVPDVAADAEWSDLLSIARRLLRVNPQPFETSAFTEPVIAALRQAAPADQRDRQAQLMPMAGVARPGGGPFMRTGPRDIAPFVFDGSLPHITLRAGTMVTRLLHRGGTVTGLAVRSLADGAEHEIGARTVVVAGDTLRTPQLLWASGIRPDALGLRLNEHASIDGNAVVDVARFGLSPADVPQAPADEPFTGAYWSPSTPERQTHGQLMERVTEEGFCIGMGWYSPTEIRPENRIEFSDTMTDALGMPHMTVHFSYSDLDLEKIEIARATQLQAGSSVGDFTPGDSDTLPAGASLHYTGTVRAGRVDDGASVCDSTGKVWGFGNLYVAGNGVVPTALTCNSTLTGAALAVRTGRAAAARAQ